MEKHGLTDENLFAAGGACTLAEWLGGSLDILAKELHKLHLERDRDNVSVAATQIRLIAERLRALDPAVERVRRELMEQRVFIDPSIAELYSKPEETP